MIVRIEASPRHRRPTWPSGDLVTVGHENPAEVAPAPVRHGARSGLVLPAVVLGLGVPRMLLTGTYAGLHGTAAWALLAVVAGTLTAVALLTPVVPALARRAADLAAMRSALHAHTDPGPGLRTRLDVHARRVLRLHWAGRVMPVLPAVLLLQGRWDRPETSLPAAAVLVAGYVALALWHRRQTLAAAAWVVDRPGPLRAVPPAPWWEPWLGGRRALAVAGAYTLAVVVVSLLAG